MKLKVSIAISNRILSEGLCALMKNCKCDYDIEAAFPFNSSSCDDWLNNDILVTDYNSLSKIPNECLENSKIIVMDNGLEKETIASLFVSANIVGFINADADVSMLCKAIKVVNNGEVWIDNNVIKSLLDRSMTRSVKETAKLTERELALLRLIREGYRNKEIAEFLSISEQTVKSHLNRIYRKMNVSSRTHLISRLSNNIIP